MAKKTVPIMVCSVCGAKLGYPKAEGAFYGSPVRSCPSCQSLYADHSYRELAIDGLREEDAISSHGRKSCFARIVTTLAVLLALGVVLLFTRNLLYALAAGAVMWCVITVLEKTLGLILACCGRRKLNKLRAESEERLRDRNYAHTLLELGYRVPEQYL